MRQQDRWITLSHVSAAAMLLASAAGVFLPATYANERASWAAQGFGQDIVNLALVFPLLVVSGILAQRGSIRARLVWLGALTYVVYSYVLYAFFVRFGPWFPIYVAALGFSAYALAGGAASTDVQLVAGGYATRTRERLVAGFLFLVGAGFAALWLKDIGAALLAGRAPSSVESLGFPVNPVHVLDLALVLPGMIATGVLVWRRRAIGFLFAVPLLLFALLMGLAIVSMSLVMQARGVTG